MFTEPSSVCVVVKDRVPIEKPFLTKWCRVDDEDHHHDNDDNDHEDDDEDNDKDGQVRADDQGQIESNRSGNKAIRYFFIYYCQSLKSCSSKTYKYTVYALKIGQDL